MICCPGLEHCGAVDRTDVEQLVAHARAALGSPAHWTRPAGHPDALALCMLHALWAADGPEPGQAVADVLALYRELREEDWGEPDTDGVPELLNQFELLGGPARFADKLKKQCPASSVRVGVLNTNASAEACELLTGADVRTAAELRALPVESLAELERAWRRIAGQRTGTSFQRLLRLAGCSTLPVDRRLAGFVADALGADRDPAVCAQLLAAAAAELGLDVQLLAELIRTQPGAMSTNRE
jgi:hypothetical protein